MKVLTLFSVMRKTDELPYTPSIRESILAAKLLKVGYSVEETVELTALNVMYHWDTSSYTTARELALSLGCVDSAKVESSTHQND